MVRHEAAEALGAIGDSSVRNILQNYCNDPTPEVSIKTKFSHSYFIFN